MATVSAAADRLEQLAATIGPQVLAYLARRVSPVEDAADIYSQVLTITWQKLRVVPADDREAFAWMLGVARRCLANHRRGLSRRSALTGRLRDDLRSVVTQPETASSHGVFVEARLGRWCLPATRRPPRLLPRLLPRHPRPAPGGVA